MKCKNKQTKQCVDELNEFKLEMRKYISTKCHCKFSSCMQKYRILLRYVLELCAFKLFRLFFLFSFSFILFNLFCVWNYSLRLNRLTANPTKWSNTLKQFAGYRILRHTPPPPPTPSPEIYGDLVNFELFCFQNGGLPFLNLLRELIFLGVNWLLH